MLDKTFSPNEVEARIYEAWEASGAFRPKQDTSKGRFSIVIPPPNVTGRLHMGHALNNTLQDVLVRFERMRGKSVLWQPGTDHAGIATQMVVERQLAAAGNESRVDLGRDEFLKRVWAWKEESGGQILQQLRRLGASCDWSRERFTMDAGLSAAVAKVFVQLHREGLIYRDKRLVNWDTQFESAISDLEVENREVAGFFWHFKYPLENGETYEFPIAFDEDGTPTEWETRDYIAIATTRPETMLGDGAVAVHPSDARYAPIVGKRVLLPLADRYIPIIADDYPDPTFGSGAVKITGAHDFNDYKVARAHDIPLYVLMDTKGRMLDAEHVPGPYRGLDRFEARKRVVADIEARGLLLKVEPKKIMQPFGDRSGTVIEPMLTDQWYVNAGELAKAAIAAVETGETRFVPEGWVKTYFQWMRNIEPWCVSRQLWWGHQIPAWYGPEDTVFVEETPEAAHAAAKLHFGHDVALARDPDVLDTWFSSALWPFSTLGWPEKTPELERFYKTDVLVTGFDIIFFWVARMMMMGLHFLGEVPFHTVYIHALVRDAKGQKMSKSKGNVIDPMDLIDSYGADALRFTLAAMAAQGRDIRLSEDRVQGYRNFGTKLWNAARFCEMNECMPRTDYRPGSAGHVVNRWIVGELQKANGEIIAALEAFRFNDAAGAVYRFVWNVLCDWYLELAKPLLNGDDAALKAETRATAGFVLEESMKLLHPFMPFITEELWARFGEMAHPRESLLITTDYPQPDENLIDAAAEAEMGWVVRVVSDIRSLRAEVNIPPSVRIPALLVGASVETQARVDAHGDVIRQLARLETFRTSQEIPDGSLQIVVDEATIAIPLADVIDVGAELARLAKERGKIEGERTKIETKLANPDFRAKAKEEVIEEQEERLAELNATHSKLSEAIGRLEAARASR